MVLHRISGVFCAAVLSASFTLHAEAASGADAYPSRPGRLIVPFGAGAATDIIARMVAAKFSEQWGQQVVIDNRAGSGGVVGTEIAARLDARRLHDLRLRHQSDDHPGAVLEAAVRPAARLHPDLALRHVAERSRRAPFGAGEERR